MTYKNMSRTTNLIDEYINNQDPEHRSNLYAVRDTIREQLPSAEEKISWSIRGGKEAHRDLPGT